MLTSAVLAGKTEIVVFVIFKRELSSSPDLNQSCSYPLSEVFKYIRKKEDKNGKENFCW